MWVEKVVVNASPLICLFRAGLEGILGTLWTSVAVPDAVWNEVLAGPKRDRAASLLGAAPWARKVRVPAAAPLVANWDLGPGESAVLTFALENPGHFAIVDDAEARRCAKALGVPRLGTGGVLILAKHRGVISSVADALASLRASGLWLSDAIVAALKAQAGE